MEDRGSRTILLSTINAKWIHPSLALRLLKANLGELAPKATILEFALRQALSEKVGAILEADPAILALSVSIWNHEATLELLGELRARWEASSRGAPVVILGGPEISNLPESSALAAEADWILRGEGEHAFRELCRTILGVKAPFRDSGPPGAAIRAISGRFVDAAPVDPATIETGYSLYSTEDLSRKLSYVEASRGCPFGCEFCLSSLDRTVRHFPLGPFLADMDSLLSRGAGMFKFLDRSFNLDTERARTILEFFLAKMRPGLCVHFEMVPSRFPPELRSLLERFPPGSLRLEVGIQTLNPIVASTIGRASDPERELETIDFLRRRTQAIVHADLIAGLPGEDLDSFARGFDHLFAARPTEIQLGTLKRLPGTPLARHDAAFGMRYSPRPPYEVESTSAMSRDEMDSVKNFARFWELIANRGHFDDLIPELLSEGTGAYSRFSAVAEELLRRFGRNWGIDRRELRSALEEISRAGTREMPAVMARSLADSRRDM